MGEGHAGRSREINANFDPKGRIREGEMEVEGTRKAGLNLLVSNILELTNTWAKRTYLSLIHPPPPPPPKKKISEQRKSPVHDLPNAGRRRRLPLPLGALSAVFSTTAPAAEEPTVSYLISSCGLSPAAAARAAHSVRLDSPGAAAQADAVLALLRRYGFSDADISSTIRKLPIVLVSRPAKTLQPKLDFLASVGIAAPLLPRLISLSPILLYRSVQDHLAPLFASLREVLGSDTRVVAALHQMPFVIRCMPKSTLFRTLPLLRDVHGLSPGEVSKLIGFQPGVILLGPDRISEIVEAVRNAGVEPGSPMFVHIFAILSKMKAPTLESKIALYQRLGFGKDGVTQMIRRYPASMAISERKIEKIVGFLISKAGLSREDIVTYPTLLVRSLEVHSRRCAVLAALRRAGKWQGQHRLTVVLASTEERFLQVYVRPHVDEVPDILRAKNGEIPFEGFDGSEVKPKLPRKKTSA
ncbi:uncharacterized protein LOC133884077 [Phragmites australis]|uniref:uncharacterized protein LOC133884077 n=1 Tax=Phragmites australis TaxID=29695 RepID=UPI002D764B9D|nr:uncharacterized protein LOC133884077 [Phragmites australis]